MTNELTNTELSAIIPELWRSEVLEAREPKQVVVGRVINVTGDVKQKGDILHFTEFPSSTLSINTVTAATGAVTNQSITLTDTQLTVDTWEEMTVSIVDKAMIQSDRDAYRIFSKEFGKKMASRLDNRLLAQYSNLTGGTLGGDQNLTLDMLVDGVVALDNNNVPMDKRSYFFAPVARGALYKIDDFNKVQNTGDNKSSLKTGMIGDVFGSPVFVTTDVATATTRQNLYIHREALAIGIQRNLNIEKFGRVAKATVMSADFLYGIKVIRANHGVVLQTKTALSG